MASDPRSGKTIGAGSSISGSSASKEAGSISGNLIGSAAISSTGDATGSVVEGASSIAWAASRSATTWSMIEAESTAGSPGGGVSTFRLVRVVDIRPNKAPNKPLPPAPEDLAAFFFFFFLVGFASSTGAVFSAGTLLGECAPGARRTSGLTAPSDDATSLKFRTVISVCLPVAGSMALTRSIPLVSI